MNVENVSVWYYIYLCIVKMSGSDMNVFDYKNRYVQKKK